MTKSRAVKKSESKIRNKATKPKNNKKAKLNIVDMSKESSDNPQLFSGDFIITANPLSHGLLKTWNTKLVSWNVNGLRASIEKKSLDYLREEDADIIGLQEIKCSDKDIPAEAKNLSKYSSYFSSADKSGYAGTSIYSKIVPLSVSYGIGKSEHDCEGRVITAEYSGFYFVNAYVPNSGRGLVRLDYRTNSWNKDFIDYLKKLDEIKPIIVCGDLNVSHQEIDLANPKTNGKTAGFTKEEREGFSELLESVDLVDTFRLVYPERTGAYTFWSYMGDARSRNIGWRLDYFLVSRRLLPAVCNQELRTSVKGSDHCPIVLYLNM